MRRQFSAESGKSIDGKFSYACARRPHLTCCMCFFARQFLQLYRISYTNNICNIIFKNQIVFFRIIKILFRENFSCPCLAEDFLNLALLYGNISDIIIMNLKFYN